MLWNIHIFDPKTKMTHTRELEVPNTSKCDHREAYRVACKEWQGIPEDRMLAVPKPKERCLCAQGDPCDYHAATCITCNGRCSGHPDK